MKENQIIDTKIISGILYAGRVLGIIEVKTEKEIYRIGMYRSTGSNVAGEGMWFPFCGLAGPGEISRTEMHVGWIIKGYIYSTNTDLIKSESIIRSRTDHANPELRWTSFVEQPPFSLKELNLKLMDIFIPESPEYAAIIEHPVSNDDARFINEWFIKGLLVLKNQKNLEEEIQKQHETALLAELYMY